MKIDADVKGKLKLVYGSVGSIDSDSDFETEQETLSDQEEHEGLLRGHHRYLPANKKILKRSNGNSLIGHPMNKKSRIDDEAPPPEKNIRITLVSWVVFLAGTLLYKEADCRLIRI